jgi:hypothetical protein
LFGETLMMMSTKPGFVALAPPTMVTNVAVVVIVGCRLHSEAALRVMVARVIWPPAGFTAPRLTEVPAGMGWKGGKLGRTSP